MSGRDSLHSSVDDPNYSFDNERTISVVGKGGGRSEEIESKNKRFYNRILYRPFVERTLVFYGSNSRFRMFDADRLVFVPS